MHIRQRGAINPLWAGLFAGLFAFVAMAGLFWMRYERNLVAEVWNKVAGGAQQKAVEAAREVTGGGGAGAPAALRKCIIDGKTVISNTDCADSNKTSQTIAIHDSRGIEAPKKPQPDEPAEPTSNPMIDKIVEKQTR